MTDDLPHLLLDLAGLSCRWFDPTRSVINDRFDASRPRLLRDDKVDYDLIMRQAKGNAEKEAGVPDSTPQTPLSTSLRNRRIARRRSTFPSSKEWITTPERSLGSNHVVLGGMMLPVSAMSISCFIETG